MGSLPLDRAGIGSATDSTAVQIGGALGVAVLGSVLNTRYQDQLLAAVARFHIPPPTLGLITSSLGGSLAVAQHIGGRLGARLALVSRLSFVHGMDLALAVGAGAVAAAALVTLASLPSRPVAGVQAPVSGVQAAGDENARPLARGTGVHL